jgi:hypothetical protein
MKKIVSDDIDELDEFGLANFCVLESFHIDRTFIGPEPSVVNIDIILRTHPGNFSRPELARVKFYFFQCFDLKGDGILSTSGFELAIRKHRSSVLEEVRFRVNESEWNSFEFLCGGFVAEML